MYGAEEITSILVRAGIEIIPSPHPLVIRFQLPSPPQENSGTKRSREIDVRRLLKEESSYFPMMTILADAIILIGEGTNIKITWGIDRSGAPCTLDALCNCVPDVHIKWKETLEETDLQRILLFFSIPFIHLTSLTLKTESPDQMQLFRVLSTCAPSIRVLHIAEKEVGSAWNILEMMVEESIPFPYLISIYTKSAHYNVCFDFTDKEARAIEWWILFRAPRLEAFFWNTFVPPSLTYQLWRHINMHTLNVAGSRQLYYVNTEQRNLLARYTFFSSPGELEKFISLLEIPAMHKWKHSFNDCIHEFIRRPYSPIYKNEVYDLGIKYLARETSSSLIPGLGEDFSSRFL